MQTKTRKIITQNFTHLLLTFMLMEALITLSNPCNSYSTFSLLSTVASQPGLVHASYREYSRLVYMLPELALITVLP